MKAGTEQAVREVTWWRGQLSSVLLALPVAVVTGTATAFFLWALDEVTAWHWAHPEALWGLPLVGLLTGWIYQRVGRGAEGGNQLLLEAMHEPGTEVPLRMAPLVLVGTLATHLAGGSAGREGTAVQMGGSLASGLARWLRVVGEQRRLMLMSGVAAGFGAVFGTPWTGALFAMEVLVIGRVQYAAALPLLVASGVGDAVCLAWGAEHTVFRLEGVANGGGNLFGGLLLGKVALAGLAFGLVGRGFAELTHGVQRWLARWVQFAPWRPMLGGIAVLGLVWLVGTRDYLGLGVEAGPGGMVSISAAFESAGVGLWSWLGKMVFTAVTVGSGFKGGEVTPLFFMGATLGHGLGQLLQEPVGLFAALGFVAVFAGAAKTPWACTLMGIEIFGGAYALHFGLACWVAFYASGRVGIYRAQRLARQTRADPVEGRR